MNNNINGLTPPAITREFPSVSHLSQKPFVQSRDLPSNGQGCLLPRPVHVGNGPGMCNPGQIFAKISSILADTVSRIVESLHSLFRGNEMTSPGQPVDNFQLPHTPGSSMGIPWPQEMEIADASKPGIVERVGGWIQKGKDFISKAASIFSDGKEIMTTVGKPLWEGVKKAGSFIWDGIKTVGGFAGNFLGPIGKAGSSLLSGATGLLKKIF